MNNDSLKTSFLEKLNSRKNYDLFGLDIHENLHWGKLFVHLFGEYFSRYSIWQRVNTQELIQALIKHYSLQQSQILRIDRTNDRNPYEIDYECSEILLILKKGFMVGIINNRIEFIYSSSISEAERNKVIQLVEECKIIDPIIKKFHMIQR